MKNTKLKFLVMLLAGLMVLNQAYSQDKESILLKDYKPVSIFKIPVTNIQKAKYPIIDMHAHDYAKTPEEADVWVKKMDSLGIQKTIILTGRTGQAFDAIVTKYSKHPERFDIWCGFDYSGFDQPGWTEKAVAELERCKKAGAKGVGEISDKGQGITRSKDDPANGMHIDDPRMKPLLEKCADLGLPINIHVADPIWAYLPIDNKNDGLMSAFNWRIDMGKPGMYNHGQLIQTLERAVRENPRTTFIACHLANCDFDLSILGNLLDKYPNLHTDISARFYQTATIPRHTREFYQQYSNRILYGTDMSTEMNMYRWTLRVLESADEHFYFRYTYHWPMYGLNLDSDLLKKMYHENAQKILELLK
ncbi:MAG: amidohydrolase family protein [Prolixibacteraceae bacterium]|nr:amidohydrolase family protein [Prolixibacteraceae bacterium]